MNDCSDDGTYTEDGATREVGCEAHGKFVSSFCRVFGRTGIWSKCPTCESERKRAAEAQKLRELEEQRRRDREEEASRILETSHLPRRHRGKGFAGFDARTKDQKHALQVAKRYTDAIVANTSVSGSSLVLIGRPGTGKTHLATAIGETLAANCIWIEYTTVAALTQRLRASYTRGAFEAEDDILNEMRSAALLILDEVGTDRPSEHDLRVLQDLIDFRYRDMRRTIVISNLPMNELAENVGDRIVDRLREMATIVAFTWSSHRAA